jgi:hypothetical protein
MMTVPTIEDFDNATLDLQTVAEVSNVGYSADTTVNRTGTVLDTLNGRLKKLGYEPAIAYSGGIFFNVNDNAKTIERNGLIYAPKASQLPFTTTGNWATDQTRFLFIAQGDPTNLANIGFQLQHSNSGEQNFWACSFEVNGATGAVSNVIKNGNYGITASTFGPYTIPSFPSPNGISAIVNFTALPFNIADFKCRATPLVDNRIMELQSTGFSNFAANNKEMNTTFRMVTDTGAASNFDFFVEFYVSAFIP